MNICFECVEILGHRLRYDVLPLEGMGGMRDAVNPSFASCANVS